MLGRARRQPLGARFMRNIFFRRYGALFSFTLAAGLGFASHLHAAEADTDAADAAADSEVAQAELAPVTVTATGIADTTEGTDAYAAGRSATATGMNLTSKETPQSTSVVTRTQMDDFGLDNINEVLATTTGVRVERVETDRTYYTARGFDITNFQMDGQGLPFTYGNVVGDLDTVIYDRIEVLRGSNGLMSGTGTPSATINFIRKRPTEVFQGELDVTVGAWNRQRVDMDVSNALNDSGTVRGRAVTAYETSDSYLDRYQTEKGIAYGVVEVDLTDSTLLALGVSYQNNNSDSPLWGALPLYNTDGAATDYDVSTSTAADWSYWDGDYTNVFAELTQQLSDDWQAVASVNYRETDVDSALFYVYGTPDPTTPGSDLYAYPSLYESQNDQVIGDLRLTGAFDFLGRTHQAIVGASYWESKMKDRSDYGQGIGTEIPALENWNGYYPKPAFDAAVDGSDWTDRQKSAYAAVQFKVLDPLALIAGTRVVSMTSRGTGYGTSKAREVSGKSIPYASLVYDLNRNFALYGSYAEIFDPQTEEGADGNRLDPVEGITREAGIKGAFFDNTLQGTLAVFRTDQENLAVPSGLAPPNDYFVPGDGIESEGYEIDISGEVLPGLQLSTGFTHVEIEDADGDRTRTFTPRKMAHLSAVYRLPGLQELKLGGSLQWQDEIYREQGTATTGANAGSTIYTRQDAYTLVNLMAGYDVTQNFNATLNLNNITDEKYITSLYWGQGYYGAPQSAELHLSYRF